MLTEADFCKDNVAQIQVDFIHIRDQIQLRDWTIIVFWISIITYSSF